MTDDELRESGKRFIESQKAIRQTDWEQPREKEKRLAEWDFVDPLRVGIYLAAASVGAGNGTYVSGQIFRAAFAVDLPHIMSVCTSVKAFVQPRDPSSLRMADFNEYRLNECTVVSPVAKHLPWSPPDEPGDG